MITRALFRGKPDLELGLELNPWYWARGLDARSGYPALVNPLAGFLS
jgi:hypothetical protein